MKEEEKKLKYYRVMPSLQNGTLEEWEAFNPYSTNSAYIKQHFIYKLKESIRKPPRINPNSMN
jgi:hypothetical protein